MPTVTKLTITIRDMPHFPLKNKEVQFPLKMFPNLERVKLNCPQQHHMVFTDELLCEMDVKNVFYK